MKNNKESIDEFLDRLKINGNIKWTLNQDTPQEKTINLKDLIQEYATQQAEQSKVSDEDVCKMYSSFYGESIDNLKQLVKTSFDGEELKEFIQHCFNTLTPAKEECKCSLDNKWRFEEEIKINKCADCKKNLTPPNRK